MTSQFTHWPPHDKKFSFLASLLDDHVSPRTLAAEVRYGFKNSWIFNQYIQYLTMKTWLIIVVVKLSLKIIQAWMRLEPMSSAIPVQCSTNWAIKPTNPIQVWITFLICIIKKHKISLKQKKIFQKGKCHCSLIWKAFQISRNYFSLHLSSRLCHG